VSFYPDPAALGRFRDACARLTAGLPPGQWQGVLDRAVTAWTGYYGLTGDHLRAVEAEFLARNG
jgi:hypothetical protein